MVGLTMRAREVRLAVFAMAPQNNAATRMFCERPLPYLARMGIHGSVFVPASVRLAHRLIRPGRRFRRIRAALYWYCVVAPRRVVQIVRSAGADVVFIQGGLFRYNSPPVLELLVSALARSRGKKLVYHCDDALWNVSRPSYYRKRFSIADLVLTGNREIAEFARQVSPNVRLFDGMVDVDKYEAKSHEEKPAVVIGWVGHFPSERVGLIRQALRDVCSGGKATIKVVSDRLYEEPLLGDKLRFEEWSLEREFELFNDFDIGIMPLADTPYNRGKEAFKIKEYMAAGLPVVCSPVGHNAQVVEHGRSGFLAATEDEWVTYLSRLVHDAHLRQSLGARGRQLVSERYSIESQALKLGAHLQLVIGSSSLGSDTAFCQAPERT